MSIDFIDYQNELLETTREGIKLAKEYLTFRKSHASNFNKLVVLLDKSKLNKSKKSLENKIAELLSHPDFGKQAQEIYKQMLDNEATYKGLEMVCKAYQAHSSGLQSVLKMQISGEINEASRAKYGLMLEPAISPTADVAGA